MAHPFGPACFSCLTVRPKGRRQPGPSGAGGGFPPVFRIRRQSLRPRIHPPPPGTKADRTSLPKKTKIGFGRRAANGQHPAVGGGDCCRSPSPDSAAQGSVRPGSEADFEIVRVTDDNGDQHDFCFETFDLRHECMTLCVHLRKTLRAVAFSTVAEAVR